MVPSGKKKKSLTQHTYVGHMFEARHPTIGTTLGEWVVKGDRAEYREVLLPVHKEL